MSGIGIDFAADAAEMANDLGATLTWGAQSITVTTGTTNKTDDVEPEGMYQRRAIEVLASVADFTSSTLPELHVVVGVGGINYQVEEIALNEDNTVARISLDRI